LTVHFTDLSSGNPISWVWDFGDGVSSIWEQNPIHTYNQPGEYEVILAVSDAGLNVDFEIKSNYITVTGQAGNPPVADFSATPTNGETPLAVQFTDLSINNPTSWSWDFGDGGSSNAQNPSYVYTSAGTYTVELTATNTNGDDTVTKVDYITVNNNEPLPTPTLSISVSTEYPAYKIGDRVYITVEVSDDLSGEPVSGATINIQITTPSKQYTDGATTNAAGDAEFQFKIKKPDGIGVYTINAEASVSGYEPGSSSTTFLVD